MTTSTPKAENTPDILDQAPEPKKGSKGHIIWAIATVIAFIAILGGGIAWVNSSGDPTQKSTDQVDLEDRGFVNPVLIPGAGRDHMVSVPGYKPACRFLLEHDGLNWTLIVPNSSTGDGAFEYPNPNAPQFAAKFPEQLKGCELGE